MRLSAETIAALDAEAERRGLDRSGALKVAIAKLLGLDWRKL